MTTLTLNPIGNLQDTTTSAATINSNNTAIVTAVDSTLSTTGPNVLQSDIDMNSNQILNLPTPSTNNSPLRLQDLTTFNGGGTITNIPTGGAANAVLIKNTSANYDVGWSGAATGTGSTVLATSPTLVTPNIGVATATSVNKVTLTAPASSAILTLANGKTLTANNTLTLAGSDGTTLTFQGTDTYVGKATTDTLTNKTYDTAGAGNVLKVNGTTISKGQYPGTTTNDSATAGNYGEFSQSTVIRASATPLTTVTSINLLTLSLTAGDWDVWFSPSFLGAATTTVKVFRASLSLTTATHDFTLGRGSFQAFPSVTVFNNSYDWTNPTAIARFSLSGTTNIFAVVDADFAVSTCSAYGTISARRRR